MQGNKESRHSSNRVVGNVSSSHVFKGELSMVSLTKSSVRSEMSEGSAMERKFRVSRWVR